MTKQPEAIFRTALIKHFRKHHCKVYRVEPAVRGIFGLGDLWVVCLRTKWAGWVEVKWGKGKLSTAQEEFRKDCFLCGIRYIEARKVEDIAEIIPTAHSSKYNHIEDFYRKHPEWREL